MIANASHEMIVLIIFAVVIVVIVLLAAEQAVDVRHASIFWFATECEWNDRVSGLRSRGMTHYVAITIEPQQVCVISTIQSMPASWDGVRLPRLVIVWSPKVHSRTRGTYVCGNHEHTGNFDTRERDECDAGIVSKFRCALARFSPSEHLRKQPILANKKERVSDHVIIVVPTSIILPAPVVVSAG
jgi:hypothetical protein